MKISNECELGNFSITEECDCESCKKDWDGDKPRWKIIKIKFESSLITPDEYFNNSHYSVEDINSGAIAWLRSPGWMDKPIVPIHAGCNISEFKRRIWQSGGNIYIKETGDD